MIQTYYSPEEVNALIDSDELVQLAQFGVHEYTHTTASWRPATQEVILHRGNTYMGFADGNILDTLVQFYGFSPDVRLAVTELLVFADYEEEEDSVGDMDSPLRFSERSWSDYALHNLHFDCELRLQTNEEYDIDQSQEGQFRILNADEFAAAVLASLADAAEAEVALEVV
jgi:hypothetical protein